METAISIRNITKTYVEGGAMAPALQGVTLDIKRGEIALLMGPSGSGKTTLISIMGCILRATSGTVEVCGRDTTHLSERELPNIRLRHIGFVFQGFNLFPTLTAGENVEMTLELKGVRGSPARMQSAALLERVGLGQKYRSFPADLSGGQKQRVAIARALAGSPDVILADEPTAALDSHSGAAVMEMLHELACERNCAVAIVTHDNRILKYADRIIRIEDGQIAETAREERGGLL